MNVRRVPLGGAPEAAVQKARTAFTMFAHHDPSRWVEIMPRAVDVHAKFYELEPGGTDRSVAHHALFDLLREAGYAGSVSGEWEGHAWVEANELMHSSS